MSASFTIDDADLDRLAEVLGGANHALAEISRQLAEEALDLVKEGWRRQASPDGTPWAPKQRDDGRAILVRFGALRASFQVVSADASGFSIATSVSYGTFHQDGTRHMPARPMVPTGELPAEWVAAFDEVVQDVLTELLSKG